MKMIYSQDDLNLLIAETERGDWTRKGVLKTVRWMSSPDNILCEYFGGNCTNQDNCRDCLTYGLLQFIKDEEYDCLQNILQRIKERENHDEQ